MKRFHVNIAVADLNASQRFYTKLFNAEPTVRKQDYAKWMLDDPQLNFSIAQSKSKKGIQHIGLQAETPAEFEEVRDRLSTAGAATYDQPLTECCYARSSKTWVRDPDDVSWEAFLTHGQIEHYGAGMAEWAAVVDAVPVPGESASKRCCA
jgi:catechol 2,3-dioxygenase-like lactoylglutathione lyase family enzyme